MAFLVSLDGCEDLRRDLKNPRRFPWGSSVARLQRGTVFIVKTQRVGKVSLGRASGDLQQLLRVLRLGKVRARQLLPLETSCLDRSSS
jgi:hypothetical protein